MSSSAETAASRISAAHDFRSRGWKAGNYPRRWLQSIRRESHQPRGIDGRLASHHRPPGFHIPSICPGHHQSCLRQLCSLLCWTIGQRCLLVCLPRASHPGSRRPASATPVCSSSPCLCESGYPLGAHGIHHTAISESPCIAIRHGTVFLTQFHSCPQLH